MYILSPSQTEDYFYNDPEWQGSLASLQDGAIAVAWNAAYRRRGMLGSEDKLTLSTLESFMRAYIARPFTISQT